MLLLLFSSVIVKDPPSFHNTASIIPECENLTRHKILKLDSLKWEEQKYLVHVL